MAKPKDPEKLRVFREKAKEYAKEYRQKHKDDPVNKERVRLASARYYERHKGDPEYMKKNTACARAIASRNREIIDSFKIERGCSVCGETHPAVLDLHHRDPSEKKYGVGALISKRVDVVMAELEKCDVLCSNCHRKLHWEEKSGPWSTTVWRI